jgi:hypothetical protein
MWRWPRATPEHFLPTLPDGAWYQRLQLQAQCPGMTSKAAGQSMAKIINSRKPYRKGAGQFAGWTIGCVNLAVASKCAIGAL